MESRKLTAKRVEAFLGRLSEFANALRSEASEAEIDRELDVVIGFLLDFKRRLNSVPTSENMRGLETSISALRHFVRIAEADPVISRALGIREQGARPRATKDSGRSELDIKHITAELRSMTPEEMRRTLDNRHEYTVSVLRHIGAEVGVRLPSSATRATIVEQIVKRVGNLAGYDYLRNHA